MGRPPDVDVVEVVEVDRPAVQVVEVGVDSAASPVFVPGAGGGSGVAYLDQLQDVTDTAGAVPGAVLTRGVDGLWRGHVPVVAPGSYTHQQLQPAGLWQIPHHLGFLPTFTAYDTDGRPVMHAGITHPVPGEISEVRFGVPFAGSGYAS